jgi:hypothetical protein
MLRTHGVSHDARKRISLMLRSQFLEMASHDLAFVRNVSTAERAVLNLACRQLAYKAAKIGSAAVPAKEPQASQEFAEEAVGVALAKAATQAALKAVDEAADAPPQRVLDVDALTSIRKAITALQEKLTTVPGGEPDAIAPPPLILCKGSEHLGRPSLATLLGLGDAGPGLLPPKASSSAASIDGAEIIGLYFSAGCKHAARACTQDNTAHLFGA